MTPRALPLWFSLSLPVLALATSCTSTMMHYPAGDATQYMEGQGGKTGRLTPGEMRFRKGVCKDYDLHADFKTLDETALADFLRKGGFETTPERARPDLVYLDVTKGEGVNEKIRLRVAILKTPGDAGKELHEAVLQHGEGSWGVHRSNLAVLAPIAETGDAVAFAVKTHLACWGVFVMAGRDDSFVVPGAYTEL